MTILDLIFIVLTLDWPRVLTRSLKPFRKNAISSAKTYSGSLIDKETLTKICLTWFQLYACWWSSTTRLQAMHRHSDDQIRELSFQKEIMFCSVLLYCTFNWCGLVSGKNLVFLWKSFFIKFTNVLMELSVWIIPTGFVRYIWCIHNDRMSN